MNPARVAALLRELADELEGDVTPAPASEESRPRRKRPRMRVVPQPKGTASPLDRAAARKALRREGLA